ncbi:hypothetical protein AB0L50_34225 [Streptomyces flaveolus]|uniref:hypothetical protein n=1 Tax=Streptomyces flaveolus TaxID=67297 RepID=UPI003420271C
MPTPEEEHRAVVAATAEHIRTVVSVLRELDFGDTPPAAAFHPGHRGGRPGEEARDAAV